MTTADEGLSFQETAGSGQECDKELITGIISESVTTCEIFI